jgi:uncharacterized protein YndB with AHSA1/START domain
MTVAGPHGTIAGVGNTRTARFERVLPHPADAVWEALTSREALARWFMPSELEPHVGGTAWFDTGDGVASGTVTAWDPPRGLAYTWPFPEDGHAHVAWTLEPLEDGAATLLVMVHTSLPAEWAAGYGGGWHAYLDRLGAHLGGGEPPDWAERAAEVRALYDSPPD